MDLPTGALSNGLSASDWASAYTAPLPLAQALLVALRAADIPAYVIAEADESAFRALTTRSPLDHIIYVDRDRKSEAKTIIQQEIRELEFLEAKDGESDIDQEFAAMVADLDRTDRDEEHFTPPSPALHITTDPVVRAAWAGIIGGPLLLLANVWGVLTLAGLAPAIGVIAFVGGFIALVMRMPDRLSVDEGPDDGAVI